MPTVSISMAKPASARNDSVALSASMTSSPLRPRTTPARSRRPRPGRTRAGWPRATARRDRQPRSARGRRGSPGEPTRPRSVWPSGAEPSRGTGDLRGSPPFALMILGLLLALASALATNVAFLLKYRGAVVWHADRGPPSASQCRRALSLQVVRDRVAGRDPRVGAARRRTAPGAVVDRPGRAVRRAGLPGRPRRTVLRLPPRTLAVVRRHDHGRRAGVIGLTGGGADRPQHSSLAALIAVEGAIFTLGAALLAISAHRRVLHRPRDSCSAWPPGRCSASPTSPSSTSPTPKARSTGC